MPITFKKSALITAAKEAIAAHDRAVIEWDAAKAKYRVDNAPIRDARANVKALRDELTRFLKTGRQPTVEDARQFKRVAQEDYLSHLYQPEVSEREVSNNVPTPSGFLYRDRADKYRGLIKMLEANLEDTITAAQLKLFGYTDLETLFRRAAEVTPAGRRMSKQARWRVEGRDMTPDGYHDQLLYEGNSVREVWRAYRSARRNEMQVCVTRRWP